MLIIDKFSPSHLALPMTLSKFAIETFNLINDYRLGYDVYWSRFINIGIHFLVFIGTMIHNEIFIINKCGLNEKTQLFLNMEFKKESIDNEDINDSDENSNDEDKEIIEID